MTLQYLLFTAIQWSAPAAFLLVTTTAVVAAVKRPALWSISFSVTASLLFFGMIAGHLALYSFGTQEVDLNGNPFTRFQPFLRSVELLAQLVAFTACYVGCFSAIRILLAGDSPKPLASATDDVENVETR